MKQRLTDIADGLCVAGLCALLVLLYVIWFTPPTM